MKNSKKSAFIFTNLATSLDGKINIAGKGHFPLGTKRDWQEMQRLRKKADAIIFGAETLRGFKSACCVEAKNWPQSKQPLNVVLSSKLEGFSPRWPFFVDSRIHRLLVVGPQTPAARIRQFSRHSEVLVLNSGKGHRSLALQVTEELQSRGLKNLLVEGGGGVMWEFARAELIDEIHLTLTPRILGGRDAPTLVEGAGFSEKEVLNFKIKKLKRVGEELFLTYARSRPRGIQPAW